MSEQKIPEGQMPDNVWRALDKSVKVMRPPSATIGLTKIPATRYSKCSHRFIAQRLQHVHVSFHGCKACDLGQHINDRLGIDAGNGRTADVMEGIQGAAEGVPDAGSFAREILTPRNAMGLNGQDEWHFHIR